MPHRSRLGRRSKPILRAAAEACCEGLEARRLLTLLTNPVFDYQHAPNSITVTADRDMRGLITPQDVTLDVSDV